MDAGQPPRRLTALPGLARPAAVAAGPETLGGMVRRLRLEADLTLEGLSEASGVSDRALSDIERGAARGPQHRTVLGIAAGLGLPDAARAALVRAARDGRRRAAPSSSVRLPLPRDVADFVGREPDLATLTQALTAAPGHRPSLCAVTGPPGYGKTSLAVRAAALVRDAFPEQLFLSLGGLTPEALSPDAVVDRAASAMCGGPGRGGKGGPGRDLLDDRRVLVVLDDVDTESQVRALQTAAGRAAVLVTSRRSLAGLDNATRVSLDLLGSEDAVRLLGAIVPAGQSTPADLVGLASLCDHVPLALRIAGNRVASHPGWTAAGLVARMGVAERRLDALTAGDQQMATTIRRSFEALGPGAQHLFRRLASVDDPTFDTGLAAALIGQPLWCAERLLDELAGLCLVQPSAQGRYTVHALLRLFPGAEPAHEPSLARAAVRPRPAVRAAPSRALSAS